MELKFSALVLFLINFLLFWCFVSPQEVINSLTTTKLCLEPISPGLCRGKVLRYAYNNKTKSCVSFYYSGCGATQNNFLTYEECRRDCISKSRY